MLVNSKFKIKTPDGFKDFAGIRKLHSDDHVLIKLTSGQTIQCTKSHPFINDGRIIYAKELSPGTEIDRIGNKADVVEDVVYADHAIDAFDIVGVEGDAIFEVNGVLSHNCDFISSGQSVIEGEFIKDIQDNSVQDPIEKRYDNNMWIWKQTEVDHKYLVTADVARGDGGDFSAFHVIDLETLEQVVEFKAKVDTTRYANILLSVSTEYNDALLVVENNNVGWSVLQILIDRDYRNLFWSKKDIRYVDSKTQYTNKHNREAKQMIPGFTTSSKNRPLIIDKLAKYVREKQIKINSIRMVDELYVFIFNNGRPEALKGYNDDLVISLAIGIWIRDTALKLHEEGLDTTRNALSKMSSNSGVYVVEEENDYGWTQHVGDKKESLTWLIE